MSFLGAINEAVKARLDAQEYFAGVAIYTQDEGDINNKISSSLARLGSMLFILHASADCIRPNLPGPYLENVEIIIEAAENVTINRAGASWKTALDLLEHAAASLHLFKPETVNEVFLVGQDAIRLVDAPVGASVAYHLKVKTQGGIQLAT